MLRQQSNLVREEQLVQIIGKYSQLKSQCCEATICRIMTERLQVRIHAGKQRFDQQQMKNDRRARAKIQKRAVSSVDVKVADFGSNHDLIRDGVLYVREQACPTIH
ncbi:hypothetical protein FGO68_gene24 [Halteria grandinella]|uniref:Uncharacterized protein n=1 Tax=Halteria grandinella TaxID=5974 RepID=A0A8J8NBS4_HALGN|nr:hypothetical protein FGO68_gene24 [Halteria grandinella]